MPASSFPSFTTFSRVGVIVALVLAVAAIAALYLWLGANPLKLWNHTPPRDATGGTAGEAKPRPSTVRDEWLKDGPDGSLIFTADVGGARTSGTKYARSELRELDAKGEEISFDPNQPFFIAHRATILEVPVMADATDKPRMVIAQIHGPKDELTRFYYTDGVGLSFVDDKAVKGSGVGEVEFVLKDTKGNVANPGRGKAFDYAIALDGKVQTAYARIDGVLYSASEPISPFWQKMTVGCYSKVGVYLGVGTKASGTTHIGTGRGVVQIKVGDPIHGAGALAARDAWLNELPVASVSAPAATTAIAAAQVIDVSGLRLDGKLVIGVFFDLATGKAEFRVS